MKKVLLLGSVASCVLGALGACTGDDTVFARDAGLDATFDVVLPDATPLPEAGADAAPDARPVEPRLLLTMNNRATSELVALNLVSRSVDGRLTFPGFIGSTYSEGEDPYLLQSAGDVVARLDRGEPWKIRASWTVAGDDRVDGGDSYANPVAVVVSAGSKAYVLRYNRNKIAVLDTGTTGDAAPPTRTIDLSSLVATGDRDGLVDMTSAVWIASRKRLYVALGNIDKTSIAPPTFDLPCPTNGLASSIIAIDTDTDQIVPLGGTGKGGGIALTGYNVAFGVRLVHDASQDRLVVLSAGCGPFATPERRRVEEVRLSSGQPRTLLDLDAQGFPGAFLWLSPDKAVLGLGNDAFLWDPTKTTIGAKIAGAPGSFAYDGKDLVGTRPSFLADGGAGPLEVVRVPLEGDAGITTLTVNPFTDNSGFVGSVEVWPRR